ncbi:MAG: hypothetical protein WCV81_05715 [Microgenomates group bacterium]|jgi:hypothetical protein
MLKELKEKFLGKSDLGYICSFEVNGKDIGTITEITDIKKAKRKLSHLAQLEEEMEYRGSGMFDVSSAERSARNTLREMLIVQALNLGGTHIWLSQASEDAGFVTGIIQQKADVFKD